MKRRITLLFALLVSGVFMLNVSAQDTYLLCDFEEGLPASFKWYDRDGLEPSVDMKNLGFDIGIPWVVIDTGNNKVACSTSWYRKAGQSDDWMVTPVMSIKSEKTVLSWRAMAIDAEYTDGYSVYISGGSDEPDDFTNKIFSVSKENAKWITREINLSDYVDKDIYIAFVNDSKDKHSLYVDDIFVGVPSRIGFTLDLGDVTSDTDVTIRGAVFPALDTPITAFNAHYLYKDNTYKKEYSGLNIQPGESFRFEFDEKMKLEKGEVVDYEVWLTCEGDTTRVKCSLSSFGRRIVAEEPTGTWCSWCVRGIVYMHELRENYPDSFIGIAIHNADPMADDYYDSAINSFYVGGYPRVIVNRNHATKGNPQSLPEFYQQAISEPTKAAFGVKVELSDDQKSLTATTIAVFAADYENAKFKIVFVMTEDEVRGTGIGYSQFNAYAEGGNGEMGGYENLPNPVPADQMVYQDVARSIFNNFYGIEGSVPAVITKGEAVTYQQTLEIPESVMNIDNVNLIALLLNSTGEIENADIVRFKDLSGTAIGNVQNNNALVSVKGKTNNLLPITINALSRANVEVSLFTVSGQKVYQTHANVSGNHELMIPVGGLSGVFILRVIVNNKVISKKVIL